MAQQQRFRDPSAAAMGLYDDAAENLVLAAVLKFPEWRQHACEKLDPDAFSEIQRVLVFDAVKRLFGRNQFVSDNSVLAEARICAGERGIADLSIIAEGSLSYYNDIDLTGFDVRLAIGRLGKLANARTVTPAVQQIIQLLSMQLELDELQKKLAAIIVNALAKVNTRTILYGWETVDYLNGVIAEIQEQTASGKRLQFTWPWRALARIATPLVGGMVGYIGAPDKAGKTTLAEIIAAWWAKKVGANVAYFHTEYPHEVMLMRRLAGLSGIDIGALYAGRLLTPEQMAMKVRAEKVIREGMQRVHYVHASGMLVDEIVGQMYALHEAGNMDVMILDYFHDIRFAQSRGGNEWYQMGEAMKTLHRALGNLKIPGLFVVRGKKEMLSAKELDRSMIEGASAVIYKSQLTILATRDVIVNEGGGTDVVEDPDTGKQYIHAYGKPGELSKLIRCKVDAQTMGPTGQFNLWMASPYYVTDVPALLE